ncbi:MAG: right-handed parallel beta-helix repeat-containing protein [Deltaproteobacteria bacterium]|nr:right-handed parallel beta-helix repeat-containing protein [Deltaproteobacteria bacterium]
MNVPIRALGALALCVAGATVAAPSARAAAPSNDDYAGAEVIGALPYDDVRDISEATGDPADATVYGAFPTVWYVFTPSEDMDVRVDVSGSDGLTGVAAFVAPPEDASLVDGNVDALDVSLTGGVTYAFLVVAIDPPGTLAFSMTRTDVLGPPREVVIGPADAADLQAIVSAEPSRPLTVIVRPGTYELGGTVVLDRSHVRLVAKNARKRPVFQGPADGAPLFSASGVKDLAFVDLVLADDDQGGYFEAVRGLEVRGCDITAAGQGFIMAGGAGAVVADNRVAASAGPGFVVDTVDGVEITGNVVSVTQAELGLSPAGFVAVGSEPQTADGGGGPVLIRGNRVTVDAADGSGAVGFVGVSYGGLTVTDNAATAGEGFVAVAVDQGRLGAGTAALPNEIARNVVHARFAGFVVSGGGAHVDVHHNVVDIAEGVVSDGTFTAHAGIVLAIQSGAPSAHDNVVVMHGESDAGSFGIYAFGESLYAPGVSIAAGDDLTTIADNTLLGARYGVRADCALSASVVVEGNTIALPPDGVAGISAGRAGGFRLVEAAQGAAIGGEVDHPFIIRGNTIGAAELGDPSGEKPVGISAWSLVWSDAVVPLEVSRNHLVGNFSAGINAAGTPAVVRDNDVTGLFDVGVDTLDFPPLEIDDDPVSLGGSPSAQLADAFADAFPAPHSAIVGNALRLLVRSPATVPALFEAGAEVGGNRFGFLLLRPWNP